MRSFEIQSMSPGMLCRMACGRAMGITHVHVSVLVVEIFAIPLVKPHLSCGARILLCGL
jgi:hypothetical protein